MEVDKLRQYSRVQVVPGDIRVELQPEKATESAQEKSL